MDPSSMLFESGTLMPQCSWTFIC